MIQRRDVLVAACGATALMAGCVGDDGSESPGSVAGETLTLTTTTSTYDTGLLSELHDAFEVRYGASVDAVAQGTGAALQTARNGDCDVVMVHARSLEDEFMRDGYGVNRRDLMFNDFVVVGPNDDPAGIDGTDDVMQAFQALAETEAVFVSRGDNSGTYQKERQIWTAAGIDPAGDWYREAGSGMGEVLNQASESRGYTLSDRGTFISQQSQLSIDIRVEGPLQDGPELLANPYGIVAVNPEVHNHVNYDLAMAYIGFLTSREGQDLIREYTVDGKQLFFPDALSEEPNFEQYVPEDWRPDQD